MMKKKVPTVVLRKLTPHLPQKNANKQLSAQKSPKLKEKAETPAQKKTPENPLSPKDSSPPVKCPPPTAQPGSSNGDSADEHKKKKERKSSGHQAPPPLLGPELFSTPDIIRRVSVDKPHPTDNPSDAAHLLQSPVVSTQSHDEETPPHLHHDHHQKQVEKSPEESVKALEEQMEVDMVQSLMMESHDSKKDEVEMSAESLLESIHAEVVKDDSTRLLAEALLLDDLTHEEDALITTPPPKPAQPKKAASTPVAITKEKRPSVEKKQGAKPLPIDSSKSAELEGEPEEEEMVSDDESWKSEDDPDRLWCICKKPHNNRFMICCDTCEDWFHGKCVGITKALGQQMELKGVEWSCPNCKEAKKAISKPAVKPTEVSNKPPNKSSTHTAPPDQMTIGTLKCVECEKPARANSIYCSDVCIKKHVLNMLVRIKKETEINSSQSKVALMEKKTGKLLPSEKAPAIDTLVDWLLKNQTYEIMPPSALPPNSQFYTDNPASPLALQTKVVVANQGQVQPGKATQLKQMVLTSKVSPAGTKQISLATKGQPIKPAGIQLIQPQPLPSAQEVLKATKAAEDDLKGKTPRNQVVTKVAADSSHSSAPGTPVPQKKEPPKKKETIIATKKKEEVVIKKEILVKKKDDIVSPPLKKKDDEKTPIKKKEEPLTCPPSKKKDDLFIITVKRRDEALTTPIVKKASNPSILIKKPELTPPPLKRKEESVKKEETPKRKEIAVKKKEETPVPKKKERKRKESTTEVSPTQKDDGNEKDKTDIRSNVKRTLHELLTQRIKDDPELSKALDEVTELSTNIEEELFNFFKDTGAKYKSKYRSLVFNIKDPKNLTLYKKIVDKSISPFQLVRLTPDELASQELAQWRENEAKHQIEIIKKNELDLIHQAKTVVLKSRKGEEILETKNHNANISELESALNRTAEDEMDELERTEAKIKETELELRMLEEQLGKDRNEEKRKSERKKDNKKSSSRDDRKSRERSRSRRRGHSRSRSRSRDKRRSSSRRSSRKSSEKEKEDRRKEKKEIKEEEIKIEISDEMPPPPSFLKEIATSFPPAEPFEDSKKEDSLLATALKEEDLSDREPSSTVDIKTPPFEEPEHIPLWTGVLNMSELTKLYTTAYEVSGCCDDLQDELNDPLNCVGRIVPESVWEYVSRMKKAGTKDIILIRFQSDSEEEKMNYLSIYSYLNSKNRMAVIESTSKSIKDFYVFPLASHSPVPQVLLPLDGPGFDDYRPHLLLGIIVRSRKKKPIKLPEHKIGGERSYTPPLPADGGSTPPLPNKGSLPICSLSPPRPEDNGSPYSPGADDPYSPQDSQTEEIIVRPNLQDDLAEVNWMIQQKQKKLETITQFQNVVSEVSLTPSTGSFTPPRSKDTIPFFESKFPDINLPPDLPEILAHINKAPAPIGPLDIKSDPIVQAYTNSKLDYDEEDSYSPPQTSYRPETKASHTPPPNRDPRQRLDFPPSALSQLTSADLIRKAAEMEQSASVVSAPPPELLSLLPPLPPPPPISDVYIPSQPPPIPTPASSFYPYPVGTIPPPFVSPPQSLFSLIPPPKYAPKFREKSRSPTQNKRRKPYKSKKKRGKWDDERSPGPSTRPTSGRPGDSRSGNFRGQGANFDRGRFNNRGNFNRGNSGGMYRGHYNRPKFDPNVQSEWDEEIRNFEQQRKVREDRERRKRRSRTPSPRRRTSFSPPRRKSRRSPSQGD